MLTLSRAWVTVSIGYKGKNTRTSYKATLMLEMFELEI